MGADHPLLRELLQELGPVKAVVTFVLLGGISILVIVSGREATRLDRLWRQLGESLQSLVQAFLERRVAF